MRYGPIAWIFIWCSLISTPLPDVGSAFSQDSQRVPVDLNTTQQKAIFVGNLVTKSVSARTIENDGDGEAKAALARARDLAAAAQADLEAGQVEQANRKLDEALHLVNDEARRISKDDVQEVRLREAFDKRHHAVTTFLGAYKRVASDHTSDSDIAARVAELEGAINRAEGQAAAGQVAEGIDTLEAAYHLARGDIQQIREGQTLVRSLDFATAAEEYAYERKRNDSHFMLLRYAISEKSPSKSRLARIQDMENESQDLRRQADSLSEAGKHEEAIDVVAKSTSTLLKAIRASGIWVPG